ncbi:class I SAM-dependent DNA methyltransferase [Paenibacillus dakarensis]|uniref:class I SAM-dependent DNA methyltransferase n=1 Tax=Paenibacillus dakarensis TaxID=1527293 RepID=UPI0006D58AF1|nr:class I SAM-dependent methyltransferase [Paenibacillus dakarensis]
MLDVACGTGQHAFFLKNDYRIDGIDLNSKFVEIAKSKNPEGDYYTADMTHFQLGKKYDVITCLFSSIGYVKTLERVVKTFENFKDHLNDDGIILVEPWFTPEIWSEGRTDTLTTEHNEVKMCRMSYTAKQDRISILRFDYLFGSKNGIEYFSEEHVMGLFRTDELIEAFKDVGFDVQYDEQGISGRGMYVARRRKNLG